VIELPSGWTRATGADVFEFVTSGSRGWAQYYADEGAAFIRIGNLDHGTITLDLRDVQRVRPPGGAEGERTRLKPNDVLVSITAELGMVGLVPATLGEAYINQHIALARPRHPIEPRFVAWYLASEVDGKRQLQELRRGATKAGLGLDDIRRIEFPLAPRPEQRRIADKLDTLLGSVDACRERLGRVTGMLKRFRQSVLAAAISGELTREYRAGRADTQSVADVIKRTPLPGGKDTGRPAGVKERPGRYGMAVGRSSRKLPQGWEWVPLSRVAKLESGHTPSRAHASYWDGGIPWIGIKDARDHHGTVIDSTLQAVSEQGLANSAARLLPARTVCLSRTASVGYVTIMGKSMATSQDFANWICTPALLPEYLMYALMAEGDGLRDFGEGTTHTTIYFPELKALHLALAPPSEQVEIVRRARELLQFADRIECHHADATARVVALAPSLIAKAFRGELVPQDPNDEPASTLLASLRTAPGSAGNTSKRKGGTRGSGTKTIAGPSMLTRKEVAPNHLTTILKGRGSLTAEGLWSASQLEIDDFYAQLKDEEARGLLRENRGDAPNAPRLLEPVA
jgi:type I restriction enzyme, S subunit